MEKQLPKNWVECKLSDVFEIVTGNTPSKSFPEYYGGNIPWVKPGDINKSIEIFQTEEYLSEEGFEKSRKIPKNSVMVTCIGNLGNVAIAGTELATNQQINTIVIAHHFINKKYVYYRSLTFKKWLVENSTSTTISMVNKSNFETLPFLLPPLAEQNRIVAKLDTLFTQLETIKASMAKIPVLLKEFRQQVLTQAVTGKLTEEWRKGKELEKWETVSSSNLFEFVTSGSRGWAKYYDQNGEQLFVRITNMNYGTDALDLAPEKLQFLKLPETSEGKRTLLQARDILISITADIGMISLIPIEFPFEAYVNQHVCLARPIKAINEKFLVNYLMSEKGFGQLKDRKKGATKSGLNLSDIKDLNIEIPPTQEQQEIVSRVESLFAKADTIEQQYQSLKEKIDTLPQALLHKAFKGELTKQLESDGDARELLDEIKTLKAATGKVIKSKTNNKAAKKVKPYSETVEVMGMVAESKE